MRAFMVVVVLSASSLLVACGEPPCSAKTCPAGCCDASGTCQAGTEPLACGLAGSTCNTCLLGQQCLQGQCFSPAGVGGGNGSGGGSGGGGGGGSALNLMPQSAVVPFGESVILAAEAVGVSSPEVLFSIESGPGTLELLGPDTVSYVAAFSNNATVRIRAQSVLVSSMVSYATLSVASASSFWIMPFDSADTAQVYQPGSRQTFAGLRYLSPSGGTAGLADLEWFPWPGGTMNGSTLTASTATRRVFAREPRTNLWFSTGVTAAATTEPSIEIVPAVSTVAPNGVVQLTATTSTGVGVEWSMISQRGVISASGTFTAPSTPGIYLVRALPVGGSGARLALATVIVQ